MTDEFTPDIAVALPGGRGTADMLMRLGGHTYPS